MKLLILIFSLAVVISLSIILFIREKKKGVKCVGCPGGCSTCSGCHFDNSQNG